MEAGALNAAPPLITGLADAFRAALPDGGLLLGIDTGTRTIGTAICDAGWRFATPGKPIAKGKFARDKATIAAIVATRGVAGLVIGLPLNLDGSESPRSQSARAYTRATSGCWACRCCCGTSAGRPRPQRAT